MSSEKEQKSVEVPQHKRIAMGVPLDGTKLESKKCSGTTKVQGGLHHAKKK